MRSIVFGKRNFKEILRDPLSYIFCLGFPVVMLIIMTLVNNSIPAQAGMTLFQMQNLAPGMAFFGLSFVMIFTCIQVAGDRSSSLVMRLHASPMKPVDFIVGYTLPVIGIAILQLVITYGAAFVIALIAGDDLSLGKVILSIPSLLPGALLFISLGLLFGTMFSEKAAPGACSIVVTVSGMLGGIWMPVDTMGGSLLKISKCMPFYFGVKAPRYVVDGHFKDSLKPMGITALWAIGFYIVAVLVMHRKLQKDII